LRQNISLAVRAIKANKLRTVLTVFIIALGLMALLGILTSIEALRSTVNKNFATLGSNSFTLRNEGMIEDEDEEDRNMPNPVISRREAESFKEKFNYPGSVISLGYLTHGAATVENGNKKTNPNVMAMAVDENYISVGGYEIDMGRWFSKSDVELGIRSIILGSDIAEKLFAKNIDPLGKSIQLQGQSFKVMGVLKSKGSSIMASDNICFIPLTTSRTVFPVFESSYAITVGVNDIDDMEPAIGAATGLMRQVRKLDVREKNDFAINKSDSVIAIVIDLISNIAIGVLFIGVVTLIGAAIGLMNIMLVQVNERTREIGINMAIGANAKSIRMQFLTESVLICLIGGIIGILLGVLVGNAVAAIFNITFFIPWGWVAAGFILCFFTGILAGYYPAVKASKLNPIEALRYE
jgi:putative ABC transport system permease protein